MRHDALIDDRDRFKASVRMFADPSWGVRRRIERGARVVQHDKRAQLTIQVIAWKQIPHMKPVPDDVLRARLIDLYLIRLLHVGCRHRVSHYVPLFLRLSPGAASAIWHWGSCSPYLWGALPILNS